jgi:SlyX protein
MEIEQRLTDLEIKVAYQDKTIEDLSEVIYKQQKQINAFEKAFELLNKQIQSYQSGDNEIRGHEKPPHY